MKNETVLGLIVWSVALEWGIAGLGKFTKPDFINNITQTLELFAQKTVFPWYATYLKTYVIPNALAFGELVRYGEILLSLGLIGYGIALIFLKINKSVAITSIIALLGGIVMNLNYYLSASWSGPAVAGVNLVMGLIQLILVINLIIGLAKSPK